MRTVTPSADPIPSIRWPWVLGGVFGLLIAVGCTSTNRGLASWNQGNCAGAGANWIVMSASDPVAQNNLGAVYERGCPALNIPQSYAEAYGWFSRAAQNGLALGVRNMAIYTERGWAVEQNLEQAVALYTLAARKGDELARMDLARLGQPIPPADLVALPIQASGGSDWAQILGAALLMAPQRAAAPPASQRCVTQVVNDRLVTNCN